VARVTVEDDFFCAHGNLPRNSIKSIYLMCIRTPSAKARLYEQCPNEPLPLHCNTRNSSPYPALTDNLFRVLCLGGLHQDSLLCCCEAMVMGESNPATSPSCPGGTLWPLCRGPCCCFSRQPRGSLLGNTQRHAGRTR
jgi:hypothetical protein